MQEIVARMFPDYTRTCCQAALEVAANNEDFTAEDVRIHCEPPDGRENTFSIAMQEAKRLGIIKVISYRKARRKPAKGRAIPVYQRDFEL